MSSVARQVRVSLDAEVDAAYISFPGYEGENFTRQVTVRDDSLEQSGVELILDFTSEGRLGGIEILGATIVLDSRMLPSPDKGR